MHESAGPATVLPTPLQLCWPIDMRMNLNVTRGWVLLKLIQFSASLGKTEIRV